MEINGAKLSDEMLLGTKRRLRLKACDTGRMI